VERALFDERPSLALTRTYGVQPEKVWRAWTDPQALRKWWGPGHEPVSLAQLDVRVGGRYRIVFGGPDGKAYECHGVYKEVVPQRKLVFSWNRPDLAPGPESLVTVELRAAGNGTQLVFRHEQFADDAVRDDHQQGWSGTLDKLAAFLQDR
jgi:uncharacterized protein YndB with AHSA1/START domain